MKILAIDAASTTGWCLMDSEKGLPMDMGLRQFKAPVKRKVKPSDHPGSQFYAYDRWLWDMIRFYDPGLLAYEKPAGQMSAMASLYGYRAITMSMCCEAEGLSFAEVHATTLKKFATGSGKADKWQMIGALMDRYQIAVDDHNVADAVHLGFWALTIV